MARFIAISGLKRAGKGTIAGHLVAQHGFVQIKFAGCFKDMLRVMLAMEAGMDAATIERCIEGDLKETPVPALGGQSGRYAMQTIGSEFREFLGAPLLWTDITIGHAAALLRAGRDIVLDDLRFPHEVEPLRSLGAELWCVTRPPMLVTGSQQTPDVPWDIADNGEFRLEPATLDAMLGVLLEYCIDDPVLRERHWHGDLRHAPLTVLAGRSVADAADALNDYWRSLMLKPQTAAAAVSAGHASEQGLPETLFSAVFRNNGSIEDLTRKVDEALRPEPGPVSTAVAA